MALLCDIETDFPKSTIFPHPFGIVVRRDTAIGENCVIHQNVTIGQRRTEQEAAIIGNNVDIGANAIILGPISIGNNSKIGGGVLFLRMCLKTLLTSLFLSVDIYKIHRLDFTTNNLKRIMLKGEKYSKNLNSIVVYKWT